MQKELQAAAQSEREAMSAGASYQRGGPQSECAQATRIKLRRRCRSHQVAADAADQVAARMALPPSAHGAHGAPADTSLKSTVHAMGLEEPSGGACELGGLRDGGEWR